MEKLKHNLYIFMYTGNKLYCPYPERVTLNCDGTISYHSGRSIKRESLSELKSEWKIEGGEMMIFLNEHLHFGKMSVYGVITGTMDVSRNLILFSAVPACIYNRYKNVINPSVFGDI